MSEHNYDRRNAWIACAMNYGHWQLSCLWHIGSSSFPGHHSSNGPPWGVQRTKLSAALLEFAETSTKSCEIQEGASVVENPESVQGADGLRVKTTSQS